MHKIQSVFCLLLFLATAQVALAQVPASQDGQRYPISDGLAATVIGTPAEYQADDLPSDLPFAVRTLEPLVERETPATLRYARPLQYLLVTQPEPAPLAFAIAGTGSSALSSKCVLLSRVLYAQGYSVACLPSPTSVTFMLGAAEYPVPGRMSTDVDDLYRMMGAIRDDVSVKHQITDFALLGWSLGATEAAFVAAHDASVGEFDFTRVLLLNPAVDVWASVQRMDKLLANNLDGGIDGIPAFVARGLGGLRQIYSSGDPLRFNEDFLYRAYMSQSPDRADIAAIIGLAFRLSLANMAFAADVITRSDVIVPSDVDLGPYDSLDPYIQRSFRVSFTDYINQLLVPYWNRDGRSVPRDELIAEANLRRIGDYLANNRNIGMFTAADDPILNDDEVAFLRATFGDRARISERGGHMGNFAYRDVVHAVQEFFAQ